MILTKFSHLLCGRKNVYVTPIFVINNFTIFFIISREWNTLSFLSNWPTIFAFTFQNQLAILLYIEMANLRLNRQLHESINISKLLIASFEELLEDYCRMFVDVLCEMKTKNWRTIKKKSLVISKHIEKPLVVSKHTIQHLLVWTNIKRRRKSSKPMCLHLFCNQSYLKTVFYN